jgi:hypothetical protein
MSRSDGLVRDRDGDLTDQGNGPSCTDPDCDGWLGVDALDRPRPCPTHRADLVHRIARQRRRNRDYALHR